MTDLSIDLLPDAILVVSPSGELLAINAVAAELLLLDPDAVVGRPMVDVVDPRGSGGTLALRDGWPTLDGEIDLTFRAGDGSDVAAAVTVRVGDDVVVLSLRAAGERSGIAVISTVSHELRSPLTSVKGYTSLMLSRWDRLKDDQKRSMLEQVHHDADRVTRLVTELLDISRLETGRLVLRRQLVDLPALAGSVVEKVAMGVDDLDCTVSFGAGVPRVFADPDKVEQVLTNLVENAAKYGSPIGMQVVGEESGGVVSIAVRDAGEGIPAEDLPRVFTKFFRRDHGRPNGTGLGLWISRGLVEAHGGELTATSEVGHGSTFRFTLPVEPIDRSADAEPIGEA